MENLEIQRLDHLGVIAGTIQDLGIIEKIDSRLGTASQSSISCGEAVAGMILNGLGFVQSPLSLTPQFFENKPLEHLFRPGVEASHFNHFKLGRSLDKLYDYGCDSLFSEIAFSVCQQEQVDLTYNHLDTTTYSLTGEYLPDNDETAIKITHG